MNSEITNLIIPPWDSRYRSLGRLYNTYNYSNLHDSGDDSWLWYIPPELVLIEIHTSITISKTPNDWMTSYDNWITTKFIRRKLWDSCRLTPQEYFDLLELHINDKSNRPKCRNCGNKIPFLGKLSIGYGGGIPWYDKSELYCSYQCKSEYVNSHLDSYPKYKEALYNDKPQFHSIKSGIKGNMLSYINRWHNSNKTECYFYLVQESIDSIKFGLTYDLDQRYSYLNSIQSYLVLSGSVESMAYLEAFLKLNYNGSESVPLTELDNIKSLIQSRISIGYPNPFEE